MKQPAFDGNLIRAQDYAPCGCADKPHWHVVPDAEGQPVPKACPGRVPVEEFKGEDGAVLGYRLAR